MKDLNKDIDNLFKSKLSDLEISPPPNTWGNIQTKLNANTNTGSSFVFWRNIAAAVIIILILSTMLHKDNFNNYRLSDNKIKSITVDGNDVIDSHFAQNKTKQSDAEKNNSKSHDDIKKTHKENNKLNKAIVVDADNNMSNHLAQNKIKSEKANKGYSKLIKGVNKTYKENNKLKEQDNRTFNNNASSKYIVHKAAVKENIVNNNLIASDKSNKNNLNKIKPIKDNLVFDDNIINKELKYSDNYVNDYLMANNYSTNNSENSTNMQVKRKMSVGAIISPSYIDNSSGEKISGIEKGISSLGAGLNFNLGINKRLSLESGIYYAQLGQNFKNYIHNSALLNNFSRAKAMNVSNSIGELRVNVEVPKANKVSDRSELYTVSDAKMALSGMPTESLSSTNLKQELNYIQIPLGVRYKVIDKKIDVSVMGGFSTNILVGNNVYNVSLDNENIGDTQGVKNINYSSQIGFGIKTPLFTKLFFSLEPRMNYYFKISNSNNYKPYSISLYTGISYEF